MNKKNIIVTGSRGFIGSNLVNSLKEDYSIKKLSFEKFSKIKDINKKKYLDSFIKKNKPFAVIHLATYFSKKNNRATIVIITHKTSELNCSNCLSVFKKNKNIFKKPTLIRLLP